MAIENTEQNIYALQYHPEVRHSVRGNEVLRRFLFHIAKISPDWKIENVLEEELEKLRKVVIFPMLKRILSRIVDLHVQITFYDLLR